MSNLIPVRRADKNGKVSTKWVRPDSQGQKKASLPAPVVDPYPVALNEVFRRTRMGKTARYTLKNFDPIAVRDINNLLTESDPGGKQRTEGDLFQVFKQVYDTIPKAAQKFSSASAFTPFNNLAVFGATAQHPEVTVFTPWMIVNGLRRFLEPRDFLNNATDDERRQAIALYTVVSRVDPTFIFEDGETDDKWNDEMRLVSDDLSMLIMERPDDAERIVHIMKERETDDVDIIKGVLDHDTKALQDGVL